MRSHLVLLAVALTTFSLAFAQETPTDVLINSEQYQTLKASGELVTGNYTILPSNIGVSEHVTIHPSMAAERAGECECWAEPDDTYTLATFTATDDGSTGEIGLDFDFELYGAIYTRFWINTNGNITFEGPFGTYTPDGFPAQNAMLAPFWADVDLSCPDCGSVYYKVTDDAVYINWLSVGYFGSHSDKLNRFQAVFTPESSTIIDGDNNVQYCYEDMQWTTGDITGNGGFAGSAATVGADAGNNADFIQFGRFSEDDEDYIGPFDETSGISWLDDATIFFNSSASANENIAPIAVGDVLCETLVMCSNDEEFLDFTFLAPEIGQNITISVDAGGFPGVTTDVTEGSTAQVSLSLETGSDFTPGIFDMILTATDDGTPPASTEIFLTVEVIAVEVPDFDLFYDGEVVDAAVPYCQGEDGVILEGSPGFDSYEWSNGDTTRIDTLPQGEYTLTAFFMGCDAEASALVYQIPTFNPSVAVEEFFICEGETTIVTLEDAEDYDEIAWTLFDNFGAPEGEILTDTALASVEVIPGIYIVSVTDDTGCPGRRIVPIQEDIINIPFTDFSAFCDDDDEVTWNGAWSDPQQCAYFIYLFDSEADGWEGANIQVFIDGTGPFNFNMLTGFQNQTGVQPFHGQLIEYYWQPGLDDDDIRIQLFNSNNDIVFDTDNEDDELTFNVDFPIPFFSQFANCGFKELPGVWTVDAPPGGEGYTLDFTDVFNPVNISDPQNPINNPNTFTAPPGFNGTYNLTFESEICNTTIEFPITFWETPTVTVGDYAACDNENTPIEPVYGGVDLPGDLNYDWSQDDCDGSATCIPESSGTYTIAVSNDVCIGSFNEATFQVEIVPNPSPTLIDLTLCNGESQTLDPIAVEHPSYQYSWSNNSTDESISVNANGTYEVTVTNSCNPAGATASAVITTANSPTVTYVTDTVICAGDHIDVIPSWTGVGSNDVINWSFSWDDALGNPQTEVLTETAIAIVFGSDQIPLDAQATGVDLEFTASNFCGTTTGHVDVYIGACFLGAYNVITPDGDGGADSKVEGALGLNGLNEGWQIEGINGLVNVHVRIFDRWGGLVFEDLNYQNANPWRGDNSNGKELQDGVYFYTVSTPRQEKALQGTVTVLRK